MAIRTIRLEGDEILHKKSKEVDKIDERVVELVNDMIETMHKYNFHILFPFIFYILQIFFTLYIHILL